MEETDPSHVVREKKHIVGTDAPGPMPMVPPMGMPMSPHAAGQPLQPVQPYEGESPHVFADARFQPAEPFGGEPVHTFAGVESSALTPMEPAAYTPALFTPASPAIPATPVTPAMQGIPALPATQGAALQPHILPAGVEPGRQLAGGDHHGCCCCGDFHDGQENRPFERDIPAGDTTPAEPQQLTHENTPAGQHTPQGEVTKPAPTDEAQDSNACCACCGDKHAGLEDSPNDSATNPGTVTEPGEEDESGEGKDDCDDDEKPGEKDGSGEGKDDDCDDDEKSGEGKDDDDSHDDDEKPGEKDGSGEGKDDDSSDDDDEKSGEGKDDDSHDDDEKPGEKGESGEGKDDCPHDDEKPGKEDGSDQAGDKGGDGTPPDERSELPATQPATSGDVPQSPRTLPAPAESGETTPLSPVTSTPRPTAPAPQNAATQPESAYQVEAAKPAEPPMQAGQRVQAPLITPTSKNPPVAERLTPAPGTEKPFFKSAGPSSSTTPRQLNALSPGVPVTPGGNSPGQNLPGRTQYVPEGSTTTPESTPRKPKSQPAQSSGKPAYNSASPYSSGSLFPGSTGQGPGVPKDGNVGPDPNVKFDEASYNQLSAVISGMKSTLDDSYKIDVVYLDEELLVQPESQKWSPAVKLVKRGGIFGGSVKRESDALEKTLSTFHQALEQAKAVFKETNDLAAYDATKFTSEYPGFASGPGVV